MHITHTSEACKNAATKFVKIKCDLLKLLNKFIQTMKTHILVNKYDLTILFSISRDIFDDNH